MMNLEESQNRELLPYGSPAFQRDESDGIDALLDRLPLDYANRMQRVTLSENANQRTMLKGLQREFLKLQEEYKASLDRAFSHSRVSELENDVQNVHIEIGKVDGEISAAKSTITSLTSSIDSWESEKKKLDEEAHALRNAILSFKAPISIEKLQPDRTLLKTEKRDSTPNNEFMAKIIKLQGEIRLRRRQLNASRANSELSERIRVQHVCRGIIETSPSLCSVTKSKLLGFILM